MQSLKNKVWRKFLKLLGILGHFRGFQLYFYHLIKSDDMIVIWPLPRERERERERERNEFWPRKRKKSLAKICINSLY